MRREEFAGVLGDIRASYIEEAYYAKAHARPFQWAKWGASAACLCLAVAMILSILNRNRPEEFLEIVEIGGYEYVTDAKHKVELDASIEFYQNPDAEPQKTISIGDEEYVVAYDFSQMDGLYQNDLDYYVNEEKQLKVGFNSATGRMDSYSFTDQSQLAASGMEQLTRDKLIRVAQKYLSDYVADAKLYEWFDMYETDIEGVYALEFYRMNGAVKTMDRATIGMTIYGKVVSHTFHSLGEMKGAPTLSEDALKLMAAQIDVRMQTIYRNVKTRYVVYYYVSDMTYIKMSDGRYAMDYELTAELTSVMIQEKLTEKTRLLVYIPDTEGFDSENTASATTSTSSTTLYTNPVVQPENAYMEGLQYRSNGNGTCYVDSFSKYIKGENLELVIPSVSPQGDQVVMIGGGAFQDRENIAKITICEGVTDIGKGAFSGCKAKEIILPSSLVRIESLAFEETWNLESLIIQDGVTSIGERAFEFAQGLKTIRLPVHLKKISDGCFKWSGLRSIHIPADIKEIGAEAFYGCRSLSDIYYDGTKAEWEALPKGEDWSYYMAPSGGDICITGAYTVHCADGDIFVERVT